MVFDDFSDGLSLSQLNGGAKQFARSFDLDYSKPGILQPSKEMRYDLGDPSTRPATAVLKATNGNIYFIQTNAGGVLSVGVGSFGDNTTITESDSDAGATAGYGPFVEYKSYLYFFTTSTNLVKFGDITSSPLITLAARTLTGNAFRTLHAQDDFLFYPFKNQVGRFDGTTWYDAALVLPTDEIVTSMDGYGDFVCISTMIKNNSRPGYVYIWDGISTTVDQKIPAPDFGLQVVKNVNGSIIAFTNSNIYGNGIENKIKIYRWNGGTSWTLLREFDLIPTALNSFAINHVNVDSANNKVYFGLNAGTSNVMTTDNGIYSIDPAGRLNLEHMNSLNDPSNIGYSWVKFIDNRLTTFADFGAGVIRFDRMSQYYSTLALVETLPFRFDIRHPGTIKTIEGQCASMPAGMTIDFSFKGNQGSWQTIGSVSGTATKQFRFTTLNGADFPIVDMAQLKIAFTPGSNATTPPQLILPFIVEAEIKSSH